MASSSLPGKEAFTGQLAACLSKVVIIIIITIITIVITIVVIVMIIIVIIVIAAGILESRA